VKEKNVMNHKKVSRSTFLSEELQQDVVVSLEEMEFVFFCATMRVVILDSTESRIQRPKRSIGRLDAEDGVRSTRWVFTEPMQAGGGWHNSNQGTVLITKYNLTIKADRV
jgi:hypothetical protein